MRSPRTTQRTLTIRPGNMQPFKSVWFGITGVPGIKTEYKQLDTTTTTTTTTTATAMYTETMQVQENNLRIPGIFGFCCCFLL